MRFHMPFTVPVNKSVTECLGNTMQIIGGLSGFFVVFGEKKKEEG